MTLQRYLLRQETFYIFITGWHVRYNVNLYSKIIILDPRNQFVEVCDKNLKMIPTYR